MLWCFRRTRCERTMVIMRKGGVVTLKALLKPSAWQLEEGIYMYRDDLIATFFGCYFCSPSFISKHTEGKATAVKKYIGKMIYCQRGNPHACARRCQHHPRHWGCLIVVCMYVKYAWHAYPRKSGDAIVSSAKGLYTNNHGQYAMCTVSTVVLFVVLTCSWTVSPGSMSMLSYSSTILSS